MPDPGPLTGPLERLHYFKYQFLTAGDLQLEQDYHRRQLYELNAATRTPGVVSGLALAKSSDQGSIVVQPGLAIDGLGRPLILDSAITWGLSQHDADATVY